MLVSISCSCYLVWAIVSRNFNTSSPAPVIFQCDQGKCRVNVVSGIKECPSLLTQKIRYHPQLHVCSSKNGCDNPLRPYAVNLDGSAHSSVCQKDVICACSSKKMCPRYIRGKLVNVAGNPANSSSLVNGGGGIAEFEIVFDSKDTNNDGAIIINTIEDAYCEGPPSFFGATKPSCGFANTAAPSFSEILRCMQKERQNCVGQSIAASPQNPVMTDDMIGSVCPNGVLGIILDKELDTKLTVRKPKTTATSDELTDAALQEIYKASQLRLGCVPHPMSETDFSKTDECPCDSFNIFQKITGQTLCISSSILQE